MNAADSEPAPRIDECRRRQSAGLPVTEHAADVLAYLNAPAFSPAPIIETDGNAVILDLSQGSTDLGQPLRGIDVETFGALVDNKMAGAGSGFAFGRYGEDRELYNNELFREPGCDESRSIHMGIDLFCAVGTRVHAPLDAEIVVVANNTADLDYGPMLILRHRSDSGAPFFTLYGHLDLSSLSSLSEGANVTAGKQIAALGSPPENGNWPPHLHFQIILDLLGFGTKFPGVALPSQRTLWLGLSPSPARFFPECEAASLNCSAPE